VRLEPIHRSVHVPLDPEAAFRLFTAEMGSWWPADTHSRAEEGQETEDVVFEAGVGGRIYEVLSDGSEGYWGTVTAWEPGARVGFDWKPNDEDRPHTQVEIRFSPAEDGGTDVDREHRGWELLGPDVGERGRASYAAPEGWGIVLERAFAQAAAVAA
jgi:hypothetical protein